MIHPSISDPPEMQKLKKRIERLKKALIVYGSHSEGCYAGDRPYNLCICGLHKILKEK